MTERPSGLETAVSIDRVTFGYVPATPIIRDCRLEIGRGRVLGILGPNGTGKTTLLKLIAGILQPRSGRLTVRGRTGYVPQVMQLGFAYRVFDVVLMGRARQIGVFATPSAEDERAAASALDRVGMSAFATRPFDELSGGERQLVIFARALAGESDILVLDEPTAALDLRHQQLVLQWVRRLAYEDGLTVVFSTHQPQHADLVADDVALMFGPGHMFVDTARVALDPARLTELFGIGIRRAPNEGALHGPLVPTWTV